MTAWRNRLLSCLLHTCVDQGQRPKKFIQSCIELLNGCAQFHTIAWLLFPINIFSALALPLKLWPRKKRYTVYMTATMAVIIPLMANISIGSLPVYFYPLNLRESATHSRKNVCVCVFLFTVPETNCCCTAE